MKNYWMRLCRISELFRPRSALSAEAVYTSCDPYYNVSRLIPYLHPNPAPNLTSPISPPPPPDIDITYIEQNELQLLRCKTVVHYNKGSHKVSTSEAEADNADRAAGSDDADRRLNNSDILRKPNSIILLLFIL